MNKEERRKRDSKGFIIGVVRVIHGNQNNERGRRYYLRGPEKEGKYSMNQKNIAYIIMTDTLGIS